MATSLNFDMGSKFCKPIAYTVPTNLRTVNVYGQQNKLSKLGSLLKSSIFIFFKYINYNANPFNASFCLKRFYIWIEGTVVPRHRKVEVPFRTCKTISFDHSIVYFTVVILSLSSVTSTYSKL